MCRATNASSDGITAQAAADATPASTPSDAHSSAAEPLPSGPGKSQQRGRGGGEEGGGEWVGVVRFQQASPGCVALAKRLQAPRPQRSAFAATQSSEQSPLPTWPSYQIPAAYASAAWLPPLASASLSGRGFPVGLAAALVPSAAVLVHSPPAL